MRPGPPGSFGVQLKTLREAAGYTQEELATIVPRAPGQRASRRLGALPGRLSTEPARRPSSEVVMTI